MEINFTKTIVLPILSRKPHTGWAVSRAKRNYVECDVKQCKINEVEYLFLSIDV